MKNRNAFLIMVLAVLAVSLPAAPGAVAAKKAEKPAYVFKTVREVKRTPVKDQYHTGTCWCFATVSFLESELLRLGKGEFDLSEMFVVRHTYPKKALNYVQMHGNAVHQQGGQAHDVLNQAGEFGLVPESAYSGMNIGEKRHNHGEMVAVLQGVVDAVLKMEGTRLTPRWLEAYEAILDSYLGKVPTEFAWQGRTYTPKSFFAEALGLKLDDYIELTSYEQHPFYRPCRLEIPDNWTYDRGYYNLPIDELEAVVERALAARLFAGLGRRRQREGFFDARDRLRPGAGKGLGGKDHGRARAEADDAAAGKGRHPGAALADPERLQHHRRPPDAHRRAGPGPDRGPVLPGQELGRL